MDISLPITLPITFGTIIVGIGSFLSVETYKAVKLWKRKCDNHIAECDKRHVEDAELKGRVEHLAKNQVRIEQTLNQVGQNVHLLVTRLIPQHSAVVHVSEHSEHSEHVSKEGDYSDD